MQERRRPAEAALGVPVGAGVVEVLGDAARGDADVEGQAAVRDLHEVRDLGAVDRQVEEPLLRAGLLVVQLRALGPQPLRQRGRLAPQRFLVRDLGHQAPAHVVRRLRPARRTCRRRGGGAPSARGRARSAASTCSYCSCSRASAASSPRSADAKASQAAPGTLASVGAVSECAGSPVTSIRRLGSSQTRAVSGPSPSASSGIGRRVHHLHQLEGPGHDARVLGGDQDVRRVVAVLAVDVEPGRVGERARVGRRVRRAQQRTAAREDEPAVDDRRGAHRARGRDLAPERLGGLLVLGVEHEPAGVRGDRRRSRRRGRRATARRRARSRRPRAMSRRSAARPGSRRGRCRSSRRRARPPTALRRRSRRAAAGRGWAAGARRPR